MEENNENALTILKTWRKTLNIEENPTREIQTMNHMKNHKEGLVELQNQPMPRSIEK